MAKERIRKGLPFARVNDVLNALIRLHLVRQGFVEPTPEVENDWRTLIEWAHQEGTLTDDELAHALELVKPF